MPLHMWKEAYLFINKDKFSSFVRGTLPLWKALRQCHVWVPYWVLNIIILHEKHGRGVQEHPQQHSPCEGVPDCVHMIILDNNT